MAHHPELNTQSKYDMDIIDHIDTTEKSHTDGSLYNRNVKTFTFEKYTWASSWQKSGTDSQWLLQKYQKAPQFALLRD